MSVLETKTVEYWAAADKLATPIVELGPSREAKEKLWRLYRFGPSTRLRTAAVRHLNLRGERIEHRPPPGGGEAA
jgi:hypothetical protein